MLFNVDESRGRFRLRRRGGLNIVFDIIFRRSSCWDIKRTNVYTAFINVYIYIRRTKAERLQRRINNNDAFRAVQFAENCFRLLYSRPSVRN